MTSYKRGEIVLVDFSFSEGTGSKKRPALIISSDNYHRSRQETIIMAITSNPRELRGDTKINKWKDAGLIYPSVVTGIMRTIKSNLIIRKLGTLLQQDFQKVQKNLKVALGI